MFAIAAAIVAFLYAFNVLEDTTEYPHLWLPVALGLLALHFIVDVWFPVASRFRRE
jgi:hypothetical protein